MQLTGSEPFNSYSFSLSLIPIECCKTTYSPFYHETTSTNFPDIVFDQLPSSLCDTPPWSCSNR